MIFEPEYLVGEVAVFHHHPLGTAGGAGGVDNVGGMFGTNIDTRITRRVVLKGQIVDQDGFSGTRQGLAGVGNQNPDIRILDHEGKALGRVGGVKGHVSATGLVNAENGGHEIDAALEIKADGGCQVLPLF